MTKIISNKSNVDLDYPVVRPSLDLDFTQEELDPRITFSRGTSGTRVNRNRLIETVDANQPRFDYDPVTGECKGLLIEEQRTNLLSYSEDFSNAVWIKTNTTIQTNAITAPDGTLTADFLVPDVGKSNKYLYRGASPGSSSFTFSIYVKKGGLRYVILGVNVNFTNVMEGVFDLNNLTVSNGVVQSGNIVGTITRFGNDWYRLSCTFNPPSSMTTGSVQVSASATSVSNTLNVPYVSDGANGVYIWGAQLEVPPAGLGGYATSYIPTATSSVTRSTELVDMTGTNFSSWYNQSEGTFFVSGKATNVQNARILTFNESTFGVLFVNGGTPNLTTRTIAGPADLSNIYGFGPFTTVPINSSYKAAAAIKFPNYYTNYSLNGQISTASRLPNTTLYNNVSQLKISPSAGGGSKGNIISRISYYPRALKPSQLQFLTQ